MPRELTEAEYLRAVQTPRRRFRVLSLRGSDVALQSPASAPCYWFERNDVAEEDGRYWRDASRAQITLVVDGVPSALFYLAGRRLASCTFAYHLNPAQLGKAIIAMRRAKLAALIVPAANWALEHMPKRRRAVLETELRAVLRSHNRKVLASRRHHRS